MYCSSRCRCCCCAARCSRSSAPTIAPHTRSTVLTALLVSTLFNGFSGFLVAHFQPSGQTAAAIELSPLQGVLFVPWCLRATRSWASPASSGSGDYRGRDVFRGAGRLPRPTPREPRRDRGRDCSGRGGSGGPHGLTRRVRRSSVLFSKDRRIYRTWRRAVHIQKLHTQLHLASRPS